MKIGATRGFAAAAVLGIVCLGGAAVAANQAKPAQASGERVPLSEEVFKQITLLRGIPVDTFFEAMGLFANAMGNDCTYCHEPKAYFDKALFAQQTPKMETARQMIQMVNDITVKGGVDQVGHEDPGLAALFGKGPGQALPHRRPGDIHHNDDARRIAPFHNKTPYLGRFKVGFQLRSRVALIKNNL
jgi:hypothetical protein